MTKSKSNSKNKSRNKNKNKIEPKAKAQAKTEVEVQAQATEPVQTVRVVKDEVSDSPAEGEEEGSVEERIALLVDGAKFSFREHVEYKEEAEWLGQLVERDLRGDTMNPEKYHDLNKLEIQEREDNRLVNLHDMKEQEHMARITKQDLDNQVKELRVLLIKHKRDVGVRDIIAYKRAWDSIKAIEDGTFRPQLDEDEDEGEDDGFDDNDEYDTYDPDYMYEKYGTYY